MEPLIKIEKLFELKEKGIISQKEFDEKKNILLNQLNKCEKIVEEGSYWLPIPSFILSIIVFLCTFDETNWDEDTTIGFFVMLIPALILGIISVSVQKEGKGLAIAGITLSSIAFLIFLGK